MDLAIRCANLKTDAPLIVEFLAKNHTADSTAQRFEWLYLHGPAGPARVWICQEPGSFAPGGIAAAFPRWVCASGRRQVGWVLGDFCLLPRYRSLGPAVKLQKACLAGLYSHTNPIIYDFPSASMAAIYERLGIKAHQRVVRLAKLVRVDSRAQRWIRPPRLARALSSVVNRGLAIQNHVPKIPPRDDSATSLHAGACEYEFTHLAKHVGATLGICLERSAEYLNWRYRQHPYRRYEIVTSRQHGLLAAYGVVSQKGPHLHLVDFFGGQGAIRRLLQGIVAIAMERKLETVTVGVLAAHPWTKIFLNAGFRQREESPAVTLCPAGRAMPPPDHDNGWFLTEGDRES